LRRRERLRQQDEKLNPNRTGYRMPDDISNSQAERIAVKIEKEFISIIY
jgi:hypothetical protein